MTPINKLTLLLAAALLAGCVTRLDDHTLITTKNIDLTQVSLDAKQGRRFTGEDCRVTLLGLIPLGLPNIETAIDKALEAGHGNVLVDEVTYAKESYFIIAGQICMVAEGTVLDTRTPKPR